MIKFLHAADLHLDAPFHGLAAPEAAARRREQRKLLADMTEAANENGCDLMLLAGDLFDSDNAYPETLRALCQSLAAFRGQVFIAPGNHDCLYTGSPYLTASWPENVHIFTSGQIQSVTLPHLGCTVYGAGFCAPTQGALLEGFRVQDTQMLNLMVLHGDTQSPDSPYDPIAKEQIAASGLDYLALGHIHLRREPETLGKTVYAWPGCPMGRGFDELGEKGVYLGQVGESGCRLRFLPMPGRRYEILTVHAGADALAAIEAALPEGTREHIYRIILTGPSAPVDGRALHRALESRFYSLVLRDETTPVTDLWQEAGEDTLKGQFLGLLQEKLAAADPEQREIITLAAQLGLDAMEAREEAVEL